MLGSTFRALKHRNFQLYFGGQLVSLVGTWMQIVAQSWLIYRLTNSPFLLGLVGFASQFPVFLLAPVGGAIADRRSRREVLVVTQSVSMLLAFVLAALTLGGVVRPWHVFALAAALGAVNGFDIPTRQAFVVEMVGKSDLANAIALNSGIFNGARVLGPAVAGVLVASIGEGWCFFVNGVSFLAVIASLAVMRVAPRRAPAATASPFAHAVEGFRFVARTPDMRAVVLLLAVVSVAGMPYAVLMPVFADRVLHGGARSLGLLMGASGVGALAGALVLASRQGVQGLTRVIAVAAAAFGASLIFFAMSRSLWLSATLLVFVGGTMITQMASSNTLVQTRTPDDLRGRIMAVYSMTFMGMAPLGALLAGVFASRVGAPLTVAAGGVVSLVAAAVFAAHAPAPVNEHLVPSEHLSGGAPPEAPRPGAG